MTCKDSDHEAELTAIDTLRHLLSDDWRAERAAIERKGVDALHRLYSHAQVGSGQSRIIARFLLGLYNGDPFPFDLTDLRALDVDLFRDCQAVLSMDALVTASEIHLYLAHGSQRFEQMVEDYQIEDYEHMRRQLWEAAASAAGRPVGV